MTKLLLIEDNPGDAVLVQELLKDADSAMDEYKVIHVERTSEAVEILNKENDLDLILSDITLPDSRGTETLDMLSKAASSLPIIFMTGTNDEELAIKALQRGAQDYLVKGQSSGDVLSRSIQYAIERKKTQNEMEEIKARDLANRERIQSLAIEKKQLIDLNKSKDEFVSIASHQLRTPATAVKQYLGLILEGFAGNEIAPDVLQMVSSAYASNERQLAVIDELLKTAQLDSLKVKLNLEKVEINSLLETVISNQLPIIKSRGQHVNFTKTGVHTVSIDRDEIRLVLENLVENASKYSPNDKPIDISSRRFNNKLLIEVTDRGVGIMKEDQKKIFDKFTRVDNELSDTVSGNGLGLYWARRILKLHKGTIRLKSSPNHGSTFTVVLPYV